MSETSEKKCLACQRGPEIIPLVQLAYLDSTYWICPQHLPMLIHDPGRLAGMLPGAEDMRPAESQD